MVAYIVVSKSLLHKRPFYEPFLIHGRKGSKSSDLNSFIIGNGQSLVVLIFFDYRTFYGGTGGTRGRLVRMTK